MFLNDDPRYSNCVPMKKGTIIEFTFAKLFYSDSITSPTKSVARLYINYELVTIGGYPYICEFKLNSLAPQIAMPDWDDNKAIHISSGDIIGSKSGTGNGYIICATAGGLNGNGTANVFINENIVVSNAARTTLDSTIDYDVVTVSNGDKITFTTTGNGAVTVNFYPCKSVPQQDCVSYVIESVKFSSIDGTTHSIASENDSWYRLYSDGWCELGGITYARRIGLIETGEKDIYGFDSYKSIITMNKTYLMSPSVTCSDTGSACLSFGLTISTQLNKLDWYHPYNYDKCGISWRAEGFVS